MVREKVILGQFRLRYIDLHCATARERYELLLNRCPGIVEHLPSYLYPRQLLSGLCRGLFCCVVSIFAVN